MNRQPDWLQTAACSRFGKPLGAKLGFTLVELLVVISIMSILAAAATWSIVGNQSAGRANSAILTLGGFVDQCREYALANNTYVYVAVCQNPAATGAASEVWLGAVASADGTDISSAGKNNITIGSGAKAISKVMRLEGVEVQNAHAKPIRLDGELDGSLGCHGCKSGRQRANRPAGR